jgi:hypothetical protein
VGQGGNSLGSMRHAHPLRSTEKTASAISRSGHFRGRAVGLGGGSSGARMAHSASDKSDGYGGRTRASGSNRGRHAYA